jgi:hypothetical protein
MGKPGMSSDSAEGGRRGMPGRGRSMRAFLLIFLGCLLLFAGQVPVQAQGQNTQRISLYALDTGAFPTLTAGLDVSNAAGNAISGLKADAITLFEDKQSRPIDTFKEVQLGVTFALALDPGPSFAYRDINAVTRFDKVVLAIKNWAAAHADALGDDLSLVPTYGTLSAHLGTTAAFLEVLAGYQPNLQAISPSVDTLARALDAVTEPPRQAGMKPTVLFISSPTPADSIQTLQNLTERAIAQRVRVDVWVVVSKDFFTSSGATALKDLAIQTGGQYALFSGDEVLPDPESYLSPLRPSYRLAYTSGILTSGAHTLSVQASLEAETVTSDLRTFEINVQPPNPILVSPPQQIVRQAPDVRTTATTAFLPTQQSIDIIIEFPDGRKRALVRTTLFVDDQKVAENTAEPFNRFTWDLRLYSASGQHILRVEAVDSFGLNKTSLGVPVAITIVKPQTGILPFLSRNSLWVALAAILSSGAVLVMILAGGRIRRRRRPVDRKADLDPLTQPVDGLMDGHNIKLPWKRPARQADAFLERLKEDGEPVLAAPIPVTTPEMTFGSDPLQATRILDDASVSPLHARLVEQNGEYILSDERSTSGTWVNYEELTAPRRLQHGDVLHIGRLSYRFKLRKPPERPGPKITPTQR